MKSKPAPSIGLPASESTCRLSIINTTCDIVCPPNYLIEPNIDGHDLLNLPTYSFHIVHERTRAQILFDLGCRKDWQNSVPEIANMIANRMPGLRVERNVPEILGDGGVSTSDIRAVILSHWHYDHCGDLSSLPPKTDLLVGPGFRDAFMPGHPSNQSSPFWETDFKDRQVIEIPFSDDLRMGQYRAHDYFNDGSLYVLDVPGHAVGHICALVRTTPDTAVLLGGDVCHFTGALRPTEYIPLPDEIHAPDVLDRMIPSPCPCAAFTICHPNQENQRTTPFYKVSTNPASFYIDPPTATKSINALAEFDADPNILVMIAHDVAPAKVVPFFPKGTLSDWKAKGWKGAMHWGFLNELPFEGKCHRPPLTDGLYRDGRKVKTLTGDAV